MDKDFSQKFAENLRVALKDARKSKGLSHEKLAELSGVSRQAISKIEAGQRNPTMLTVYKLVCAMGMKLSSFIAEKNL